MTTDNHRTGADAAGHMRARVAPAGLAFVILQLGFALLLLRQFQIESAAFRLLAALMVAPLAIARGTQNKILEAMAMGVPVVTSAAAADGVDADAEHHFLVSDSAQETAQAVLRIVESPSERARLASAGRARMLSHHAWPRSMQRLDAIIENARCAFVPQSVHSVESAA